MILERKNSKLLKTKQGQVFIYTEIQEKQNRATGATEACNLLIISQSAVQDRPKIELLWCY